MFRMCVILIISPLTTPVLCESFNVFGAINDLFGEITLFANLITSAVDIFGVVNENGQGIFSNTSVAVSEDAKLNICKLATKYGYTLEEHKVTTEDGYILTLHRLPFGRNKMKNNLTVFLMHGILDSSDTWLLQGPDKALGYVLADMGFDVWMGNARGNKHALSHVLLTPKQSEFWKFTWEEIGTNDLPAMINYVLNMTEKQDLYYIGHSQGTTSFYVMISLKPEYNDKIKMMFSLAPVAWMSHTKCPIVKIFSPAYKIFAYLLSNFNTNSPTTEFFNKIAPVMCSLKPKRCDSILYMIVGSNHNMVNESMLPVILGHMPSGSSTLQFVHYGQLAESGRFCRFDFGEERNLELYGEYQPPDYDLTRITTPIVLYYSENDWLSDPYDVGLLKSKLLNIYANVYVKNFNHLDYLYATTAKDLIYSRIVEHIYDFEYKMMSGY